jgi:hypothetical protein
MGNAKEISIEVAQDPEQALGASTRAFAEMGARIKQQTGHSLEAETGVSIRSWGETMSVRVSAGARGGALVTASSRCNAQLVDWGKNEANLDKFRAAFLSALSAAPPPQQGASASANPAAPSPQRKAGEALFLSYRRYDTADVAGRIYDHLIAAFGAAHVFKDVDSIALGQDFRVRVRQSIEHCAAFLPIIGPGWLGKEGAATRMDNPIDWVRLEIEAALEKGVAIIPLFVREAVMPEAAQLPASIQAIVYHNGIAIRPDPDFRGDMERLIRSLRSLA